MLLEKLATPSRLFVLCLCIATVACSDNNNSSSQTEEAAAEVVVAAPTNPYEGYSSELYDATDNWLCRPDIEGEENACSGDLSATIVFADGSTQLELYEETDNPEVDCFYVYPTVSNDQSVNSDLEPGIEGPVTYIQAARYRSACKMFAPVYRQFTSAALSSALAGEDIDFEAAAAMAYNDVLDAFKYFVANADGRGFVLIGHSQGSSHLIRLIQQEVESQPYLAERMISAHLIGILVELPLDAELGATFQTTPPCDFDNATGCFVNYSSFRRNAPPTPELGFFGITADPDTRAACTHPVDLGAGTLTLDAYFSPFQLNPYNDSALNDAISTPFTKLPGLIQGECIEEEGRGYLAISVDADPDDPRIDDVGNDSRPGWGLHGIDVGLAQGDLVKLAHRQVDEWQGQ
jgi:hypothetical protein